MHFYALYMLLLQHCFSWLDDHSGCTKAWSCGMMQLFLMEIWISFPKTLALLTYSHFPVVFQFHHKPPKLRTGVWSFYRLIKAFLQLQTLLCCLKSTDIQWSSTSKREDASAKAPSPNSPVLLPVIGDAKRHCLQLSYYHFFKLFVNLLWK